MTSSDSKVEKVQAHFKALSLQASSLNAASDELAQAVAILDEALKKLNVGLTVWVTFRDRAVDPNEYDADQIGYGKVNGKWGIALRRIWGSLNVDDNNREGPWLFNDAPRGMRIHGVDKIPEVIEALGKAAFDTTKKVREKAQRVRQLAAVIEDVTKKQDGAKERE